MPIPVVESFTSNTGVLSMTLALTKPSGVVAGDLLLVLVGNDSGLDTDGWNDETGWTKFFIEQNSLSDAEIAGYWRVADGTEPASTTFDQTANIDCYGWYLRISGADTTTPINALASVTFTTTNSTSHAISEVTSTQADCLAFYLLGFDGGDGLPMSVSGTGWTESAEIQAGTGFTNASGSWGTKELPSAGGAGVATVTTTFSDTSTSIQFAIAGAGGGGSGGDPDAWAVVSDVCRSVISPVVSA